MVNQMFLAEVYFWNDFIEDEDTDYAILAAGSYAEAAQTVETEWGKDSVISMKLFALEEGSQTISKSMYEALTSWDCTDVICTKVEEQE